MPNVSFRVTIGSTTISSPQGGHLLELETRASLEVPVNSARICLAGTTDLSVKPGEGVSVELGYDTSLSRAFTGKVDKFERGITQVTVEALGAFSALTDAHFNKLYEKQSAGDMVGNLLSQVNIKKGRLDVGENFASFVIGGDHMLWNHLYELAQRCGYDFYADEQDQAVFKKYIPGQPHVFQYGVHILDFVAGSLPTTWDGVEVYGESPAGQGQGQDASAWFTKKAVKGNAGKTSGNVVRVVDPTARSQSLARSIASNLLDAHSAKMRGRVRVLGEAAVRLGDTIQVSAMPTASLNGTYKVTGIRQRLNMRQGFITDIEWET